MSSGGLAIYDWRDQSPRNFQRGFTKWCNDGIALLQELFWDQGGRIPFLEEYFKKRYGKHFDLWASWVPPRFDVSDKYVNSLRKDYREEFYRQEYLRRTFGLWLELPRGKGERDSVRAKRRQIDPTYGLICALPPSYYFLYNYIKLQNPNTGIISHPAFWRHQVAYTDVHTSISFCDLGNQPRPILLVLKCRTASFTTMGVAIILNEMSLRPSGNVIYTIDNGDKLSEAMSERLVEYELSMPSWARPHETTSTSGQSKHKVSMRFWDYERNQEMSAGSHAIGTIQKPSSTESYRARMRFDDEIFLLNRYDIKSFLKRGQAVVHYPGEKRTGVHIIGGTSSSAKVKTMRFLQYCAENPTAAEEKYIPWPIGWHHTQGYNDLGWPNEVELKKQKEEERIQMLANGQSAMDLAESRMTSPTQWSDFWITKEGTIFGSGFWEEQLLRMQHATRLPAGSPGAITLQWGYFEVDDSRPTIPRFVQVPYDPERDDPAVRPPWCIYRHPTPGTIDYSDPKPQRWHCGGIDPVKDDLPDTTDAVEVRRGNARGKSMGAAVIMGCQDGIIDAVYYYRSQKTQDDYDQRFLGALYYRSLMNIERNIPGEIAYLQNNHILGREGKYKPGEVSRHYISPDPLNPESGRFGFSTQKNVDIFIMGLIEFLKSDCPDGSGKKNFQNVVMPHLIQAIMPWSIDDKSPPDLAMALLMAHIIYEVRRITATNRIYRSSEQTKRLIQAVKDGLS